MGQIGRYQLEGALQSAHVHRRRTGHANWPAVVQLYDALLSLSGSPVVAINRALAIFEIHGARAGASGAGRDCPRFKARPVPALLGRSRKLLERTGANAEAYHAYEIAIGLERDAAVRRFLQRRQSLLLT